MSARNVFTPLLKGSGGLRLTLHISDEDHRKIGRGMPWWATVTDLDTGQPYKARGSACDIPTCFCDAVARPITNADEGR